MEDMEAAGGSWEGKLTTLKSFFNKSIERLGLEI